MNRAAMGANARGVWLAAFGTSYAASLHHFARCNPRTPFDEIQPPVRELLRVQFEKLALDSADAASSAFLKLTPFRDTPRKTG